MKATERILRQIQECIESKTFKDLETEKVEIKDLSGGDDWKELYKSACTFMNSLGGLS